MKTLKREELSEFFHNTHGRIFTAVFIKKDNTVRSMNCRKGVHIGLKGGENKAATANPNLSIVFDMKKREYRMINIDTVLLVKFARETYEVCSER